MEHNDQGSVVWWVVAVMGCVLAMLSGLGMVAQQSVRSAQAQAVADLSALAAVGADESPDSGARSQSPSEVAQLVASQNGWNVESISLESTTLGGRAWRVRVGLGAGVHAVGATATAQGDRVHPDGAAGP